MREFDDDVTSSPYSRKVGDRLRVIRRQKRLSLQEVEAESAEEFKASVLGAYERGERAISVPRLERLAKFYNVPVDQLLPREDVTVPTDTDVQQNKKLAIDLLKLSQLAGQPFEMLTRFLKMIQVQRQDFNGKVITVRGEITSQREAMLSVRDNCIGIAPDELEKIFDKFYQVEDHMTRHHGGLGVGLSIAQGLVEAHGGRIWAESAGLNKGATFTITLPLAP